MDTANIINSGDTAWVLISAALVFIMTPAVALFYGGMVRSKNVLSTIMQSMFILGMISVEFILIGYTMAFGSDVGGLIGDLSKVGLAGVGYNVLDGGTIPELAFVAFQCMFAALTPALITGAFAERMKLLRFLGFTSCPARFSSSGDICSFFICTRLSLTPCQFFGNFIANFLRNFVSHKLCGNFPFRFFLVLFAFNPRNLPFV